MHPSETAHQFRFARGHPLVGWLLTGALLAAILYFLSPLIAWGEQQFQGNPHERLRQAVSEASGGALCVLSALGLFFVLVVVSVINGLCASCSVVFDKETGLVTRDWQLGFLRDKEAHPLKSVTAIGYTPESNSSTESDDPTWVFRLRCYLEGDKNYELTTSTDEESIARLARRLQSFLGHAPEGPLRRDAWRVVEKIGAAKHRFEELKEKADNPLTAGMAGLLASQMARLEEVLTASVPGEVPADAPVEEVLKQLRLGPADPDLHLRVAAQLRDRKLHAEAAAVLERGADLWARAEAAVSDSEYPDARPLDPDKLWHAHPVNAEPMKGLWAQVRAQPDDPGVYFLLAVALRTNHWPAAARACASHAVQLRLARGAITANEAEEMLRDFPPGRPFGPSAIS